MVFEIDERKVFISYAWSNERTREFALELATVLNDYKHIEVQFDRWHLKPGDDKFHFMEQSVINSDYVIILCDKAYKQKADSRDGGVGDETTLITPGVYKETRQNKIIPVVLEKDEDLEPFTPNYLTTRMFVDMSDELNFEDRVDDLLRIFYGKPKDEIPESKEKIPEFLKGGQSGLQDSSRILRRIIEKIDRAIDNNPRRIKRFSREFKDEFFKCLDEEIVHYSTYKSEQDKPEYMVKKINDTAIYKDLFVEYFILLEETDFLDVDMIIEFIEDFKPYLHPSSEKYKEGTHLESQFDHFKFLLHEIFIYTTAILLNNKRYDALNILLSHEYDLNFTPNIKSFTAIRFHLTSLEIETSRGNRASVHTDMLIERAGKWRKEVVESDIFLYIISKFRCQDDFQYNLWFPIVSLYEFEPKEKNRYVEKLKYKSHFSDLKKLLLVDTKERFIEKYKTLEWNDKARHFVTVPSVKTFINLEDINSL